MRRLDLEEQCSRPSFPVFQMCLRLHVLTAEDSLFSLKHELQLGFTVSLIICYTFMASCFDGSKI